MFQDNMAVPGGAPFNVAWHLCGFGLNPLLVSRVGRDELGRGLLDLAASWGLDTAGIQQDALHPTGTVKVRLDNGVPDFRIPPGQAYDYIDTEEALAAVRSIRQLLLYHGSLAARHPVSQTALYALRREAQGVFVDINLRTPWWNPYNVGGLLRGARWVKLNADELIAVAKTLALDKLPVRQLGSQVRAVLNSDLLVLTLGDKGACFFATDQVLCGEPELVKGLVDTVGAGDAFSAVVILGLEGGWPLETILKRALEFAAAICRQKGATSREASLYRGFLRRWSL